VKGQVTEMQKYLCHSIGQSKKEWVIDIQKCLNQIKIKSKVLFKVGTFTNSTNISSRELFKPTCILRYKLQHNKTMSCITTTYQANIRCKHIYDLISGPPQSVHMWQAPLCTLTVIGPENSIVYVILFIRKSSGH